MTTARTSRIDAEVLAEGDGIARVSRLDAEAVVQVAPKAQVSRLDAEALVVFPSKARLSRLAIEGLAQFTATARLSRLAVEVLIPNNVLFDRTGDDTVSTPTDVVAASIAFTARYPEDDAPVVGDEAEGEISLYVRSGEDDASVEDEAVGVARRLRTSGDTVPEPTDAVTYAIHKLYVRTANDTVPVPSDRVLHLTRPGAFAQPVGGEVRLKRVEVHEVRSYLTRSNVWSSDVPVSRPVPYAERMPVLVDMGGFGFTAGGIAINISEAEEEENFSPFFSPEGTPT